MGATPGAQTATIGTRIGARLLDVLIVGIPAAIVLFVLQLVIAFGMGATSPIPGLVFSLMWFGYYVYFESTTGATLGKKLVNARVVTEQGTTPTLEQAAKRNAWMLVGIVPWIGGLLSLAAIIAIIATISSDPHGRGFHDKFAGTGVVR